LTEKNIEGLHSRVAAILKRAPAASLAYISQEMRFNLLCKIMAYYPTAIALDVGLGV
jgi:hypothetical protein